MSEWTVASPSIGHDAMSAKWTLIDALLGGTAAMRDAGDTYLPKMEKENETGYTRRLAGSFLFNAYKDTVRKISAKPFMKPVVVTGDDNLHDQLEPLEQNTDGEGVTLTQLARELFYTALNRGMVHLMVDYPESSGDETKADDVRQGRRPVMIPIHPDNLIAWKFEGTELVEARIHETKIVREEDGYGETELEYIRVLTKTEWELHRKSEDGDEYVLEKKGTHTLGRVPIITAYFEKTGAMTADPPLEDLAYLNLEHWQSASDQRNLLRFARTPVWFMSGMSENEADELTLGPAASLHSENPQARMSVVEHSGGAIQAGERDLRTIEEQMQLMGLRPFISQKGAGTATGASINEARGQSEIQAWIRSTEAILRKGYAMAAEWVGTELPGDFALDIYSDFVLTLQAQRDLDTLMKARLAKEIDRETFLTELKKRGLLGDDSLISEIMERVEQEGPDLSTITGTNTNEEDENGSENEDEGDDQA